MLVQTPEIHLHGNNTKSDPIYSVHVQPRKSLLKDGKCPIRIVTAGITEIRIWLVTPAEANALGVPQLEFRATLERHEATVNIVRFSPDGLMIASGDVDGVIILWKFSNEIRNPNSIAAADIGFVNIETWTSPKVLRRHHSEVTDLAWSPDGKFLISTSVDDSSNIWDVEKGEVWKNIADAKNYVLGASWDPLSRFVATLSADKALRLYHPFSEASTCVHKITQFMYGATNEQMFIGDDNCLARRRLDFSPDGKLIIAPSGALKLDTKSEGSKRIACSYIFNLENKKIANPVAVLPAMGATCLVRFCPKYFNFRGSPVSRDKCDAAGSRTSSGIPMDLEEEIRAEEATTAEVAEPKRHSLLLDGVPYRMVYAIASAKQVVFYDTQMERPFAMIDSIHVADLSDLAWTDDGRMLVISSLDGYCSFVEFAEGELGETFVFPSAASTSSQ